MEEPTVEEVLDYLLHRQSALEEAYGNLVVNFNEMFLDHQALLQCMRRTGQFNRDMFKKVRMDLAARMEEENGE